ncbi:MAG: DNA repair protein RecN [Elusimicrobia bacterium]|nr:DNA repair protein RecN [Elusimicrobiota bacterium]
MLRSLAIKDFAVIAELEIGFTEGLNILTGETGAGKTILIEALGFLLGARGSLSWIRAGAPRLSVAGVFDPRAFPDGLRGSFGIGGGPVTVLRELDASGKTRATIGGRAVRLAALSAWGDGLVDFHGQHEHQALLKPSAQLECLDRYAGLAEESAALAAEYDRWGALVAEREALKLSDSERGKRIEFCRFQLAEIEAAKLKAGEEGELEAELPLLKNAERLRTHAESAYQALYEAEGSVSEGLLKVARLLGEIARLDDRMKASLDAAEGARLALEDVAQSLGRYRGSVSMDPGRLDETLTRLETISRLKKKYGPDIEAVLSCAGRLQRELETFEAAGERSGSIEPELARAQEALAGRCERAHRARLKAARSLEGALEGELRSLGMPHGKLAVAVEMEEGRYTRSGCDAVEFLLAANPGEPARPLRSVASGGELSRVMLALKTIMAAAKGPSSSPRVLVFDEVDAGVGGAVARAVGRRLARVGGSHQVLCVTHLAQVACFGRNHINVVKETGRGRTVVRVERLESERRLETIATMLGGREPTDASRRHAKELLESTK